MRDDVTLWRHLSLAESIPRMIPVVTCPGLNTLRLRQNGHHIFANILKCIILKENGWILINFLLKYVHEVLFANKLSLFQMMVLHWRFDKPLRIWYPIKGCPKGNLKFFIDKKWTFCRDFEFYVLHSSVKQISLKFVLKGPIDRNPILVQIVAHRQTAQAIIWTNVVIYQDLCHCIDDGSMQERRNSISNTPELCLSCTNPWCGITGPQWINCGSDNDLSMIGSKGTHLKAFCFLFLFQNKRHCSQARTCHCCKMMPFVITHLLFFKMIHHIKFFFYFFRRMLVSCSSWLAVLKMGNWQQNWPSSWNGYGEIQAYRTASDDHVNIS